MLCTLAASLFIRCLSQLHWSLQLLCAENYHYFIKLPDPVVLNIRKLRWVLFSISHWCAKLTWLTLSYLWWMHRVSVCLMRLFHHFYLFIRQIFFNNVLKNKLHIQTGFSLEEITNPNSYTLTDCKVFFLQYMLTNP